MPSFLHFVCSKYMGRAVCGRSWCCPFCDSPGPSFSVRPPKTNPRTGEEYPIKFKCWRCLEWGDEWDIVGYFDGRDGRRLRLNELRAEYEALDQETYESPRDSLPRGHGENSDAWTEALQNGDSFHLQAEAFNALRAVEPAWQPEDHATLYALRRYAVAALRIAAKYGVPASVLAEHVEWLGSFEINEMQHLAAGVSVEDCDPNTCEICAQQFRYREEAA